MSTVAARDNLSPTSIRRLFRSTLGTEKFGTSFQKIRETHPTRNNVRCNLMLNLCRLGIKLH